MATQRVIWPNPPQQPRLSDQQSAHPIVLKATPHALLADLVPVHERRLQQGNGAHFAAPGREHLRQVPEPGDLRPTFAENPLQQRRETEPAEERHVVVEPAREA